MGITSGVGNRMDPFGSGKVTKHDGIDVAAPKGTPIYTNTPMKIIAVEQKNTGYGNSVVAQDADGNTYRFGHLSNINVQKGQQLNPGDQVGNVGSTGASTGPHLHYEIHNANGKLVDPQTTNPANGKNYTDNVGFEKGKTLTNSKATPQKNVPNDNTTTKKDSTDNSKKESESDKNKRLKEENLKKQSGNTPNNGPRPKAGEVGMLENPLNKL